MADTVLVDLLRREPTRRQLALLYRLVCGASVNVGGTPRYRAAPVQVVADWRADAEALVRWELARWVGADILAVTEPGVRRVADELHTRGIELLGAAAPDQPFRTSRARSISSSVL
ncbi:hypothetical protein [Nocardia sp. NPDC050406]|uniref:hypothetical protein n=1 Tax=Nocardia sp. NPDC050406 TaxID=3364318 RepID=UPI0037954057